jgi:hypothetical protein
MLLTVKKIVKVALLAGLYGFGVDFSAKVEL